MILWLTAATLAAPPTALTGATTIQADSPRIACAPPWCEGEIFIDAPPQEVRATLLDFSGYTELFPRVGSVKQLDAGGIHLTLSMPFPLQDRDYVATAVMGETTIVMTPRPHPLVTDVVRLPDFAAHWSIEPEGDGCRVRYIWHTDLGADIPSWALQRAWTTQGNEVLGRLKLAVEE